MALAALAGVLAVFDLGLKAWAERGLASGQTVDLGVIQLRLLFNPGVAFSLGDTLPAWVVLTVTGVVTAGLAVFAWRGVRTVTLMARVALAAVLGGAISNLVDRAPDGVVTDYLHTGWFPTFNGADVLITLGAATLVLTSLLAERSPEDPTPEEASRDSTR